MKCDTSNHLFVTIKGRNNPNTIFRIDMESENYSVRIKYLDTTYAQDFAANQIQTDALDIGIHPKRKDLPPISFILGTMEHPHEPYIGIDLSNHGYLPVEQISDHCANLELAADTIRQIKDCMQTYFPGVLSTHT